jgi:hypothetical protein
MTKNEIFEVEKEYRETIQEFCITIPNEQDLKIFGKVEKVTNGDHIQYWGKVSHYFLLNRQSREYIGEEDSIYASTLETVVIRVKQHLENFTAKYGVLENKHYN